MHSISTPKTLQYNLDHTWDEEEANKQCHGSYACKRERKSPAKSEVCRVVTTK